MISTNRKTAYEAVQTAYAQTMLTELQLDESKQCKVLEIGTGLTKVGKIEVTHHMLNTEGQSTDFEYPNNSFDGVMLKSGFYKMDDPIHIFDEILRILKPGARLTIIEPAISLTSWAIYKFCKNVDVDMGIDPMLTPKEVSLQKQSRPNIAYLTVLFTRQEHRIQFMERFPDFNLIKRKWVGMFADPLSLGNSPYSLIPAKLVSCTLGIEEFLNPFVGRWLAHKMLITLKKSGAENNN